MVAYVVFVSRGSLLSSCLLVMGGLRISFLPSRLCWARAGRAVMLFSQNGHASFIPLHRSMLETLACLVWSIDHDTWYVFLSGLDSGIIYITRYDRIKLRSVCAAARESSQKSLQLKLMLNANQVEHLSNSIPCHRYGTSSDACFYATTRWPK